MVRQTKTGRIRSVPQGQKAQRASYTHLATGRPRCENLPVSRDGLPLRRNTVRLAPDRPSQKLGFRLSAHGFRRSFTTMMLRRGCDLETLRQMGGWSSYAMLMTYAHLAADDLKRPHATRSPLDNLYYGLSRNTLAGRSSPCNRKAADSRLGVLPTGGLRQRSAIGLVPFQRTAPRAPGRGGWGDPAPSAPGA